ncbi:putative calcium-binding protein CML13 [Platanthera zijinensis]|uniref:Calcium-binding protein CML13 n=1 Tax=Platanthera zijinensis TaxID=2320716 RepID=A0AAP0B6E8_9ASPA
MVERQEPWRVAEYLQAMQIDEMIAEVDKNGSGTIDFDDFLYMMTDKIEERDSEEDLKKAFHIIDHDNDGRISVEDIMTISKELGESFTHEEIIEMIKVADHTGDGDVDEAAFIRMMKRTSFGSDLWRRNLEARQKDPAHANEK